MKKLLIFGLLLISGASLCAMEKDWETIHHDDSNSSKKSMNSSSEDLSYEELSAALEEYDDEIKPEERVDLQDIVNTLGVEDNTVTISGDEFADEIKSEEKVDFQDIVNTLGSKDIITPGFGSSQQSFFKLHKNKLLMCGVFGTAVFLAVDSYGTYRYVKRAHMRGKQTVFDRWFAKSKTGLQKLFRRTAQTA